MAVGWSEIVAAFLHYSLRLLSLHPCRCLAQTYCSNNLADLYVKLRIFSYTGIKGYGKPLKTNPNLCHAFTPLEFVFIMGIWSSGLTLGLKAEKVLSSYFGNIRGRGRCLGDLYCVCDMSRICGNHIEYKVWEDSRWLVQFTRAPLLSLWESHAHALNCIQKTLAYSHSLKGVQHRTLARPRLLYLEQMPSRWSAQESLY